MIYLIDRGFRIKSALNILVNQCKYPGIYNECFCLNCSRGDVNDNVNVNNNDNDNDLRSSFAKNVNDNDNVNVSDNDNDLRSSFANNDSDIVIDKDLRSSFANNDNFNDNDNDIDNDNDNVNDNDLRSSFANNDNDNDSERDNFIYQGTCFADLFDEKNQRSKYNSNSPTNSIHEVVSPIREAVRQSCLVNHERSSFANSPISININDDLYSWLNDDDIITEATFPDDFRCIISGPSECGKTF